MDLYSNFVQVPIPPTALPPWARHIGDLKYFVNKNLCHKTSLLRGMTFAEQRAKDNKCSSKVNEDTENGNDVPILSVCVAVCVCMCRVWGGGGVQFSLLLAVSHCSVCLCASWLLLGTDYVGIFRGPGERLLQEQSGLLSRQLCRAWGEI